ncbi:MAG: hypothetical protein GEU82_05890 [Luteitalea sp.]|nr:hypothetical protein [Luteitalea sp.]
MLRMTDPQGRIRVKLADRDGSGLLLSNDSQQPGVQMQAGAAGSSVKVIEKDGRQQVIAP